MENLDNKIPVEEVEKEQEEINPDKLDQGSEKYSKYGYIHLDADEVTKAIIYYAAIKYTAAALTGEVVYGFEYDPDIIGLFRNMPESKVHLGGAILMIDKEALGEEYAEEIMKAQNIKPKEESDESDSETESKGDNSTQEESNSQETP